MSRRICQIADPEPDLTCPARESGGYRCEVSGPHEKHAIGQHTIEHALMGNGYLCSAVDHVLTLREMAALPNLVLANFARDLRKADPEKFDELANRAEGNYRTDLGRRERELVDFERARRTVTAGIGGAL